MCFFSVTVPLILMLIISLSSFSVQFSPSVVSNSLDPMNYRMPGFLFYTESQSLPKFIFIESVIPSNHLILSGPLLLLPSIFPSIRIFSDESVLRRALCCSFFLYPSALCWKYSEVIFRNCWNRHFIICWERWPSLWHPPASPTPVHLGERWVFPLMFCFPSSLLSSRTNSFLEASTSGSGVALWSILLSSVLSQA